MPNTSRGYPYPLSSAPADVPADLLLLAAALNTDVGTVSTTATGAVPKSTVTAKGDLFAASGSATVIARSIGINGQVLVADSAQASGMVWKDEGEQQELALVMGIY